jgi:predicted  nucleic acid-binding Zn-ribbon protein
MEQFKLSLRVRDKVTEANQAVIDIRNVREQINQRLQKVSGRRKNEIQKLADAVMVPLTAVEEEAYQVRNRSGQDPLNYPIKLNNKIAALAGVIESADNKPTDQSVEVFNELSAQLDAQLAKMKETLARQLPLLNGALKREKLEAVDPKAKPAPVKQ